MSRELQVLWLGRHQRPEWEAICTRYRERIARVYPVRDVPVRVKGMGGGGGKRAAGEARARREAEGEALLAALPDPAWPIALDSRGKALSSERFASRLARIHREWPHPVAFLVGSDLGLSEQVLDAARLVVSLGPVTLSHELARAVLYEQLYRAASIASGTGYHRENT